MERYASKVIALALEQVGYLEKKSNAMLDDKTANAGSNNYTKFARDLDAIQGFYNGKKNGYPWCDVYVDWLFVKCFGVEAAKEMLGQPDRSYGAGCSYSAGYYKKMGRFYTKNPKPGDQIFFRNYAHTGLVTDVDDVYVYTNEGNTSTKEGVVSNGGGVWEKKYLLTDKNIDGYGRPKYDTEGATDKESEHEDFDFSLSFRELYKGCEGKDVMCWQSILNGLGFNCGLVDGIFGDKTRIATINLQRKFGLYEDGIVGVDTMTKTWRG